MTQSRASRSRWLVLCIRPRYERRVEARCLQVEIDCFLPLRKELRQWSDRKKLVDLPLFPGYLFVHATERERIAALEIDGALRYVSFGGKLAEVDPSVISSLHIALSSRVPLALEQDVLTPGQQVRVLTGPLCGMTGELTELRGSHRLLVRVEAIQQAVSVELSLNDIQPL